MPRSVQPDVRLRDYRPEPSNFWIRHAAIWPAPRQRVWVDLARGALGGVDAERAGSGYRLGQLSDLVYLPPAESDDERERLQEWCLEHRLPTLMQYPLSEAVSAESTEGRSVVVDLLAALLEGDLEALDDLPPDCIVAWPTGAGLTDDEETMATGLDRLAASGVEHVVPVSLHLSPRARRRLTETFGDRLFDSLFHSTGRSAQPLARACRERGLSFFAPRPPLAGAPTFERVLSTELSLIGELWSALGDSPAVAQEFFRAAAWIESTRHDVAALVRDGNLGVVPSLTERVVAVVEELAREDVQRSSLRESLERRYAA